MNNCRLGGTVLSVARQDDTLQFLLGFRTNVDCTILVKVTAPLIAKQLQHLEEGDKVRVCGFIKAEDDQICIEAFSVLMACERYNYKAQYKFFSSRMP